MVGDAGFGVGVYALATGIDEAKKYHYSIEYYKEYVEENYLSKGDAFTANGNITHEELK